MLVCRCPSYIEYILHTSKPRTKKSFPNKLDNGPWFRSALFHVGVPISYYILLHIHAADENKISFAGGESLFHTERENNASRSSRVHAYSQSPSVTAPKFKILFFAALTNQPKQAPFFSPFGLSLSLSLSVLCGFTFNIAPPGGGGTP